MALSFCRKSMSIIKQCSVLSNAQSGLKNQSNITTRLILNTKPISQASFSSDERPSLGLRKHNLPSFPHIECITNLELETFLPSYYKTVTYGDYKFLESADGYVNVYIQGYQHPRDFQAKAGYAVYFGGNHPLNLTGSVPRRQASNHAKMFAFLMAIHQVPENVIKKLCICVDTSPLITFIDRSLRNMSDNSFRSVNTGKLNKDLETSMEINKALRLRQDFTLRLKYVPNDIGVYGIYHSTKLAKETAEKCTKQDKKERLGTQINDDF